MGYSSGYRCAAHAYPHLRAYDVGHYSPVYGDADLLPSGNVLGCFWPEVVYQNADPEYDMRVLEVDRTTNDVAWQMDVFGYCNNTVLEGGCNSASSQGWNAYSVERFYEKPFLYTLRCEDGVVSFLTHNNFKQNNEVAGYYSILNKDAIEVTSGEFKFSKYWRATKVEIDITGEVTAGEQYRVTVSNEWGDQRSDSVGC